MVIWKFRLSDASLQDIAIPAGALLLSVAGHQGDLCLWAMCDPGADSEHRTIEIIGTGNPIPQGMGVERRFIGTAIIGPFTAHVFERLGV